MLKQKKSQVAVILTISVFVILIFVVKISYDFLNDTVKSSDVVREKLEGDLKKVSFSFDSFGYPLDWYDDAWGEGEIKKIGFLLEEGSNTIDLRKLSRFAKMDYTQTKQRLGIFSDYLFYFTFDDNIESITRVCSFGALLNPPLELVLSPQPEDLIYFFDSSYTNRLGDITTDLDLVYTYRDLDQVKSELANNPESYTNIVLENPSFAAVVQSDLDLFDDIDGYVSDGGNITLGGDIFDDSGRDILGVKFHRYDNDGGDHEIEADIVAEDNLLYLPEKVKFNMYNDGSKDYYFWIERDPDLLDADYVSDFKVLAEFDDGKIAAATWKYGNGTVYYFSTFNITIEGVLDQGYETVKYIIYYFSDIECKPEFAGVSSKDLFVTSRIVKIPEYDEFKTYNVKVVAWD